MYLHFSPFQQYKYTNNFALKNVKIKKDFVKVFNNFR